MDSMVGMKFQNKETGEVIWIKRVDNPFEWNFPIFVGNSEGTCYTGWRTDIEDLKENYERVA